MILRAFEWDRVNFTNPEKRKKIEIMMGISEEKLSEIRKSTLHSALNFLMKQESNESS
jgi:hypothetical protein